MIRIVETLRVAIGGLKGNPLRSFLTVLGVVIGVTAVIVMVAIGEGAKSNITSSIQGLGSNLLIVSPGRGGSRNTGRGSFGSGTQITNDVADYLRQNCTLCQAVAPETNSMATVKGPTGTGSVQTNIVGVTPDYLSVRNHTVELGDFISDTDLQSRRLVAVLGSSVATDIFAEDDPIGKSIKIGAVRFTVIGVLKAKGQSGFMNTDDQVLIPLTTAQRRVARTRNLRSIYIQVADAKLMTAAQNEVSDLLYAKLKSEDAYNVSNQAEILSTAESTAGTFTMLLAGIAGVSLLVGGIGIMNIMLVSVTERIREIGIRKALGARRQEILAQFLFEAIALSMLGGLVGIMLGSVGAKMVAKYAGWRTAVSLDSVLLAVGFSFAVGLFFGVYPANKAAQLQPVEALRHE